MLFYHGTSARQIDGILTHGIQPRGNRPSNWKHAPSRNDMVYLTQGYPFYYGVAGTDDPAIAVFEIDGSLFNNQRLFPDEDYIWHMADRTGDRENLTPQEVAEHLESLQDQWPKSLRMLGNIAHQGTVPTAFITRYCIFHPQKRQQLTFAISDYSINVLNYLHARRELHQLTAWMFGDTQTLPWVDDVDLDDQSRHFWQNESNDRTGIEVVNLGH